MPSPPLATKPPRWRPLKEVSHAPAEPAPPPLATAPERRPARLLPPKREQEDEPAIEWTLEAEPERQAAPTWSLDEEVQAEQEARRRVLDAIGRQERGEAPPEQEPPGAPGPAKESRAAKKPRQRRRMWRRVALGVLAVVALLVLATAGYAWFYVSSFTMEVPDLGTLRNPSMEFATVVYTADGEELTRLYRTNRTWVEGPQISDHVRHALLATEDHRFYEHDGVDLYRLAGSAWQTAMGDPQGGSTITMQLARNLYPEVGRERSLERKTKEILTAQDLEDVYSKDELLEAYLNTVPFGYNAFGIEAAARTYFNTSAEQLGPAEAALLIALLKGPSWYSPVRHPERARERRNLVLGRMHEHGYLSMVELQQARRQPLALDVQVFDPAEGPAPYFADYVRSWLEGWGQRHGVDPYADGLRVHTTLDLDLQRLAERAVRQNLDELQAVVGYEWSQRGRRLLARQTAPYVRQQEAGAFEPFRYYWEANPQVVADFIRGTTRYQRLVGRGYGRDLAVQSLRADGVFMDSLRDAHTTLQAGFLALDPLSGRVLAWVGGRDYRQDQYDRVALAKRQPGSTFKPFVYTAAIDYGYSPDDYLADRVRSYRLPDGETWTPRNAGGSSGRMIQVRDGLARSVNTVTAALMDRVGPEAVARFARRLGVRESELHPVPSLALGTSEVTLLEMTSAYATLATNGVYHAPLPVTRIETREGRVLARFRPEPEKAVSMYTAYAVTDMMRGVVERGTGQRIRREYGIEGDLAAKTGTTQDNTDGWFIMMHPRLVAGAWVGFNDQRLRFRSSYWGQGAHNALRLVGDFFLGLQADPALQLPDVEFEAPTGYAEAPSIYTAYRPDSTWLVDTLGVDVPPDSLPYLMETQPSDGGYAGRVQRRGLTVPDSTWLRWHGFLEEDTTAAER